MAERKAKKVDTGDMNLLYEVSDDGILTVQVDVSRTFGRSKGTKPKNAPDGDIGPWGKNMKVSSTGGNIIIDPKTGLQLGLNVFRAPTDTEREELW